MYSLNEENTIPQQLQGLATLGKVTKLTIEGVDMANVDLCCYADVKELKINKCINVNICTTIIKERKWNRKIMMGEHSFDSQANKEAIIAIEDVMNSTP